MSSTFSAQISDWVAKSEKRLDLVVKESAQRVGLGVKYRTRRLTGFLRASWLASTASMPLIDRNARPQPGALYQDNDSQIALVIAGATLGQPIFFGFTLHVRLFKYAVTWCLNKITK